MSPEPSEDPDGLRPDSRVSGTIVPPGSKSMAQRALLLASVVPPGTAPSRLENLPAGEDVAATRGVLRDLGIVMRSAGATGDWLVEGGGRLGVPGASTCLNLGESGTLARCATALVGLAGRPDATFLLRPRGSLVQRRSDPLLAALRGAGAVVESCGESGSWPLEITPCGSVELLHLENPVSSQEVTALLLGFAARTNEARRRVSAIHVHGAIPSRPYLELTRAVLQRFGLELVEESSRDGSVFRLDGRLRSPEPALLVEPDLSSAAVALAAGCLSGGSVRVPGIGGESCQGDRRIVEHLAAFGCDAGAREGELLAAGAPKLAVASLDLSGEPDLAPVLAIVAAAAARATGQPSRLEGLGTLRGKESDRLAVLEAGLRAAGWEARAQADTLTVGPPREPGTAQRDPHARRIVLDDAGDHRMAFAFALLGLVQPDVFVNTPGSVAKSWPGFWSDLTRAGARRHRP